MTSQIVHISSKDRDYNVYPYPYDFKVNFPAIKNVDIMRFVSCSIYTNDLNVDDNSNTMILTILAVDRTITLENGSYTMAEFTARLKVKLDALALGTWTVQEDTLNTQDKLLYLANDTNEFTLKISDPLFNMRLSMLGIKHNQTADLSSSSQAWSSQIPPNMVPFNYYFIKFKGSLENVIISSNPNLKTNLIIPNTASIGSKSVLYNNYQLLNNYSRPHDIDNIHLEVVNERNELIKIRGEIELIMEFGISSNV